MYLWGCMYEPVFMCIHFVCVCVCLEHFWGFEFLIYLNMSINKYQFYALFPIWSKPQPHPYVCTCVRMGVVMGVCAGQLRKSKQSSLFSTQSLLKYQRLEIRRNKVNLIKKSVEMAVQLEESLSQSVSLAIEKKKKKKRKKKKRNIV